MGEKEGERYILLSCEQLFKFASTFYCLQKKNTIWLIHFGLALLVRIIAYDCIHSLHDISDDEQDCGDKGEECPRAPEVLALKV